MTLIFALFLMQAVPPVIIPGPLPSDPTLRAQRIHAAQQVVSSTAISAVPLSNPGTWVTTADYPAQALGENLEGTVSFRLTVDTAGVVSGCEITGSSGSPILDTRTCELLQRRARFSPARLPDGAGVTRTYANRVRWQIPPAARPEPGLLIRSFIVEIDGSVTNCKVERAQGAAERAAANSANTCPRTFGQSYLSQSGSPVRRLVRMTQSIMVTDAPKP